MEKKQEFKSAALHLIIEEVDAAREVYQLYDQLHKALPIKSFEDLRKACDKEGKLHFRNSSVNYEFFKNFIPDFIFPIEDEKGLISRLSQFVKLMPEHLGYDTNNPENIKKHSQLQFLSAFFGKANIGGVLTQNLFTIPENSNVGDFIKKNIEK